VPLSVPFVPTAQPAPPKELTTAVPLLDDLQSLQAAGSVIVVWANKLPTKRNKNKLIFFVKKLNFIIIFKTYNFELNLLK
jgi:hypothetical protein